jgi:hypothetical protein
MVVGGVGGFTGVSAALLTPPAAAVRYDDQCLQIAPFIQAASRPGGGDRRDLGGIGGRNMSGLAVMRGSGCLRRLESRSMGMLRGSCLCGGVQFEFPRDAAAPGSYCHCTSCKRLSGGVGTANASVRTDAITINAGRELLTTYQPSEGSKKTFCKVCGSNLFGGGWPDTERASVRLSSFDTPPDLRPQRHIFMRSVAPWELPPEDGLPRLEHR